MAEKKAAHEPPSVPERFTIKKRLGGGTFATVWLADDIVRGEEVALKVCRTRDANGNDIRPQLRQEFRCQACLQHPNILPVYEEIPHGEHHIFVTQPAKGSDMWTRFYDLSRNEQRIVDAIVAPLLSALAALHARGIVHRDVKMENVLITERGEVKLGDFGLALDMRRKRAVSAVGTIQAMAPELLLADATDPSGRLRKEVPRKQRQSYGASVDVWALGVLLSELLVGSSPAAGAKTVKQAAQLLFEGQELVVQATYSERAVEFLAMCLQVDVDQRPTTAQLYEHPWITGNMSASRWIELHPNKFSPPKEDVTPDLEEGVSGAGRSVRSQGGLSSMYCNSFNLGVQRKPHPDVGGSFNASRSANGSNTGTGTATGTGGSARRGVTSEVMERTKVSSNSYLTVEHSMRGTSSVFRQALSQRAAKEKPPSAPVDAAASMQGQNTGDTGESKQRSRAESDGFLSKLVRVMLCQGPEPKVQPQQA